MQPNMKKYLSPEEAKETFDIRKRHAHHYFTGEKMTLGVYCKPEPEKRPWTWIPYTKDAYTKAVSAGAMFTTWTRFEFQPGNGHGEPKRYGHFPIDFDDKANPQNALDDMRTLCLVHLPDMYGLDPYAIQFYASGSKGFHAVIPDYLFGHNEGHVQLPLIYKRLATDWSKSLSIPTLDLSLYCMGKGKMFRLPNIKRSIGTYKVPLTLDEVMTMNAEELFAFTRAPRTIDPVEVEKEPCEGLKQAYEEAAEKLEQTEEALPPSNPLNKEEIEQIRKHTPACIEQIITDHPESTATFNFNRAVMLLVNYYQDIEMGIEDAVKHCSQFLENYAGSESYDTIKKRLEHFDKIWNHMLNEFGYFFSCERAKGLGLKYDCLRCILSNLDDIFKGPAVAVVEEKKIPSVDMMGFPEQVMIGPAGFFSETYSDILEAPQHFFYMAYITLLGSYFAPVLYLKSALDTQPRLYTLIIGKSADDRKSTVLKKTAYHFSEAYSTFNKCWGINSAEGLQSLLKPDKKETFERKTGCCLLFDEFNSLISKCKIKNSVLLPVINTLFESNVSEATTKDRHILIKNAFLSFLAATTIDVYEDIYDDSFVKIGFPNRVFIVPGHGAKRFAFPEQLHADAHRIIHTDLLEFKIFIGPGIEFNITPEAKKLYETWYLSMPSSIHTKRLETYAMRFFQLLALNRMQKEIDPPVVSDALALCDWQLKMRMRFDPIDADSEMAKMEQKIYRQLKSRGRLSDRDLKRHTNAHRKGLWFYKTALENLKDADEIVFDKKMKAWRSK